LMVLSMVVDSLGAGSTYLQIQLLDRAASGARITWEEVTANSDRQDWVDLLQLGVVISTAVAFMMWSYRVHGNLRALGARNLRYSPGWAVGIWFIPIFNLFVPFLIMREIWAGSDPAGLRTDPLQRSYGGTWALVGCWWGFHLLKWLADQAGIQLWLRARTVPQQIVSGWADVLGDLATLPAAVFAILVVGHVDRNQQQRHRLRQAAAPPVSSTSGLPPRLDWLK